MTHQTPQPKFAVGNYLVYVPSGESGIVQDVRLINRGDNPSLWAYRFIGMFENGLGDCWLYESVLELAESECPVARQNRINSAIGKPK